MSGPYAASPIVAVTLWAPPTWGAGGMLQISSGPESERFALHDLKRRGITDTPGTRGEKQMASGHKSADMLQVYRLQRASGIER